MARRPPAFYPRREEQGDGAAQLALEVRQLQRLYPHDHLRHKAARGGRAHEARADNAPRQGLDGVKHYIKIGWIQRNDSVCFQPICFLHPNRALVIRLPQRGNIITAAWVHCYRIAKIELPRRGNEPIHSINISSQYDFVDYFYYICKQKEI